MSYISNYFIQTIPFTAGPLNRENSEQGLNALFEIHTLEWLQQNRPVENNAPQPCQQYGILWVKRGAGLLKIDLHHHPVIDNMITCFSPGQMIQVSSNEPMEGYFISFTADFLLLSESPTSSVFLEAVFGSNVLPPVYPDSEMQNEMQDIVSKMTKEFGSYCAMRSQILKGLLKVFIIYLSRNINTENLPAVKDRDTEMVSRFTALVKRNFLTKKMVVDYARELCVSPNYLNRVVKKISGFTASHHIQQHIILEAKRQAIYSGLSMKEVAYLLGFNDYAHFSKFFKNNSGINFTCFKNTIQ